MLYCAIDVYVVLYSYQDLAWTEDTSEKHNKDPAASKSTSVPGLVVGSLLYISWTQGSFEK